MENRIDEWEWEEPITIGSREKAITVDLEASHQNWYLVDLASSLIMILLLLVLYMRRLRKRVDVAL